MTDVSVENGMNESSGSSAGARTSLRIATWQDYVALLKPRVMSLVIFTGLVGMIAAPGSINPILGAIAIFCIAVGAGASGALNMWFDADIDAIMIRTRQRPIPRGVVSPDDALIFGSVLSVASILIMWLAVGVVPASLLALTIGFYLFIYTMVLKRRTPQNIVIGGAAGALPPVIGWAAVTGNVTIEPIVVFLIIFMWTPPHFWALSLYRTGDYEKAGVPMLPVVAGKQPTRTQVLIYSILLAPVAMAPYVLGFAGPAYGIVASVLSLCFIGLSAQLWHLGAKAKGEGSAEKRAEHAARRLFTFSLFYLFCVYLALLIEHLMGWVA